MASFVLVHGAWHGGWCWKKVTPLLRRAGHEVYTPTLTGLGERVHLASAAVDLSTHIQDVVNILEYEDLQEVVLVGHSYGGMVIAGVADRIPERIAHIVYLDAFVPQDGESVFVLFGEPEPEDQENLPGNDEGWQLPVDEELVNIWLGPADLPWALSRLAPQPIKTFQEPVHLINRSATATPATYIHCTYQPTGHPFAESIRRAQTMGWHYWELAAGHDAMVTMPKELVHLLLEVM
jgi:pimeloyl-ACP methyl ester carboxylesterase